MDFTTLDLNVSDRVAVVTLRRSERLNALSLEMWADLRGVCEVTAGSWPEEVRALVIIGEGRAFCVGGDVDDFAALDSDAARTAYMKTAVEVYERFEALPFPTIAAVHGLALGGGCELTLVCDMVVADETAMFGLPETRIGLYPGVAVARGGRQLNGHALGYLVYTGERVDAHRAREVGLVNEVVEAGQAAYRAAEIAGAVAAAAPQAVAEAKAIINAGASRGYVESLESIPRLMATNDHAEGLAALAEGRTPEFHGD